MPQTYAARVAARPAYASYKNRKKTIRLRHQAGRITDSERATLLAAAKRHYRPPRGTQAAAAAQEGLPDGEAWESGRCVDECITARLNVCRCPCGGRNHGAATGLSPETIQVRG